MSTAAKQLLAFYPAVLLEDRVIEYLDEDILWNAIWDWVWESYPQQAELFQPEREADLTRYYEFVGRYRTVCMLFENYTYTDIGEIEGVSREAIRLRRLSLWKYLRDRGFEIDLRTRQGIQVGRV